MRNKTRRSSNVGSTSGRESGTLADVVVGGGGGGSIGEAEAHREEVDLLIHHLYGAPPIRSVYRHHQLIIVVVDCRLPVVGQPTIHCRKSHREYPSNDADWHPERPELPSSRDHTATRQKYVQRFSRTHFFFSFQRFLFCVRQVVVNEGKRESALLLGWELNPSWTFFLWVSSN